MVYSQGICGEIFKKMKIGTLSKESGMSKDTIRLYEKMGLLINAPTPNEYNNYKEYNHNHLENLKMISIMKKLGFTLKECKEVLDTLRDKSYNQNFQNSIVQQKIAQVEAKILELSQLKDQLMSFVNYKCDKVEGE